MQSYTMLKFTIREGRVCLQKLPFISWIASLRWTYRGFSWADTKAWSVLPLSSFGFYQVSCVLVHVQVLRVSGGPPGALPDGPAQLLPVSEAASLPERRSLPGFGTLLAPRVEKSNFWRSFHCSWTSCTLTNLGLRWRHFNAYSGTDLWQMY